MSTSRDRNRGRDDVNERRETVRAEEMEDKDSTTPGTVTESYTLSPPTNVVRHETVREEVSVRQQPPVRQQPVRATPLSGERDVDIPESYALDTDRVRWPAVIAGLLTALTMLLTLGVLGLAVGLTSVDAGQAVAQRGVPSGLGLGSGIWAGVSALLAFALGGWVAGRTAAVFGKGWGALNGMLVFLLAVPVTLLLAGSGVGALLGSFSSFAQSLNIDPSQVSNTAGNVAGQASQAAQQVTPEQAAQAATNARNAAWSTLLGLGLGTAAATIGGLLGTRSEVTVDEADVARARASVVR